MNRNQYENTRDYKKALKILKGFVDEELDGDIDAMRTFCFDNLTKFIGNIGDPDMYLIVQAIYIILWGDIYDLIFEKMGAWDLKGTYAFRGDTINSFGSLFGKESKENEFGYRAKFFGADKDINPIYIERMTLNEKDERMAYLNYLTNLYSKKNIRMDADNQPEYAGGSDDLLEQKYLGEYVPVQDDASSIWCVQTGYGFESGDINYIASEFSGTGLIYHFMHNGERDHVHEFESVLVEILKDPEHVDIMTDYGEYSDQEVQMVKGIKRAAAFVQAHRRPMTVAELCKNRVEIKNKEDDDYGNSVQGNQAIFGKKR